MNDVIVCGLEGEVTAPMLSAIGGPVDDFWYQPVSRKTAAGVNVNEWSALTFSPVWSATNFYCALGSLPLNIINRETKKPQKIRESRVVRCLRWMANSEMESGNFLRLMWQWQVNWGNADAEIVRNDFTGEIQELIPLEPWRTTLRRNERTNELQWVYTDENGDEKKLSKEQVFHVPNVITYDGLVGQGTIAKARETIGLGKATEKYGASFFGGDGIPRLLIKHPGQMQPEAKRSFHDEWRELYSSGQRQVALLSGGAEPFPLTISAEDSQFVETRGKNAEDVEVWYGLRGLLTKDDVAEADFLAFLKARGLAYFSTWEGAINTQLIGEDNADELQAKYNLNALLSGDSAARSNLYRTLFQVASLNSNEIRDKEDLPPRQGGDTFLVQGAMVALDENGEPKSDFAGNTPGAPKSVDPNGGTPDPNAFAKIAASAKKAVENDLARMATREAKVAADSAKTPGAFVTKVDAFYETHATWLTGQLAPHFEVLAQCGVKMSAPAFVARWCEDGKEAVLSAAGSSTPECLEPTVKSAVESSVWLDRPRTAILSLE